MRIQQLKPEQQAVLKAQIEKHLDYLQRLLGRLDSRHFPRDGELFPKSLNAQRKVHTFWEYIEIHRAQWE